MTQAYIEEILYMHFIEYIGFDYVFDFFNYVSTTTVGIFTDEFSLEN